MDVKTFRLVRIFRIVRVFNKLESLQRVCVAMTCSLVSVFNVLMVFFVVNSVYAILGKNLYGSRSPTLFQTYSTSSFTMFQIATGDNWSNIVREMSTYDKVFMEWKENFRSQYSPFTLFSARFSSYNHMQMMMMFIELKL